MTAVGPPPWATRALPTSFAIVLKVLRERQPTTTEALRITAKARKIEPAVGASTLGPPPGLPGACESTQGSWTASRLHRFWPQQPTRRQTSAKMPRPTPRLSLIPGGHVH